MILLVTGLPGVGKTTVLQRVVDELQNRGFKIGGMITREARQDKTRVGFEVEDLSTGRKGWLASVNQPYGPRIGKYRVNLADLEEVGAKAILKATTEADVITIDEVGPMEMLSDPFKESVTAALHSGKTVLGTIHYRAQGPFVRTIEASEDVEIIETTLTNREELPSLLIEKIVRKTKRASNAVPDRR